MKKILSWLLGVFCSLAAFAQTVTIQVQGNRNKQINVDGTVYTLETTTNARDREPIVIRGLSLGEHSLEVVNGNANSANNENVSTSFRLRSGYDLVITVRNNGAIQQRETKATVVNSSHPGLSNTPMSSTTFNTLYQKVRRQRNQATRYNLINTSFATSANYFTTSQVDQLVSLVNSQSNRILLLKKSYLKVTDPANFSVLYDLITTENGRNEIVAHVDNYNYYYGTASSHNAYINAMSDAAFNNIYQAARNEYQSTRRMNYLVNAFADPSNYFTSYQASQLIQLVTAESDRLILAKTAYRGITDVTNFSMVRNLLLSTASRNDLDSYTRSYSSGTTYNPGTSYPVKTPMSDANFTNLYRSIESEWAPGAEMNELRKAFANTSYYFTTAQAKQLIQLVSAEANRLELAKASYRTITDPANFSLMYDILSSQASRNDLAAYVNSYSQGGTTTIPVKQAMTVDEFDKMYRSVQNTWGIGAKMNYLTNIFATPTYYFTTDQARRLIELVSSESNRLQLAKSAYKQVIDQTVYFSQVSPILSSQASRNDLELYIKNY
jgi:hypothetical protein